MWAAWWVWGVAAVLLAIAEVLVPGFVLLGFAVGAGVVALLLLVGGPLAVWLGGSLPVLLLVFAVVSLVAWLGLRRWVGVYRGQVKTFDRDINDG
jgi:membrane protein implicated in regulation of membrane protease activity